ncbi:MAG: N-6 DNA methylase [Rhodospirillaceae bacterium]|nr:N-6 DNA methylase [Rhodospirillaceae bacterium]
MISPVSERELAALAVALAGPDTPLTEAERKVATADSPPSPDVSRAVRRAIAGGADPLGEAFCRLRSPTTRRACGAIYTPRAIIDSMVKWAARQNAPARIVDPGTGSGRFLLSAARMFPDAELVAVEIDPLAALTLRANASVLGLTERLSVLVEDYRTIDLAETGGPTLFLGNPPYVRHHGIAPEWKAWFAETATSYGLKASKLAGMHIHFFLKTRAIARQGDYGAFVTSAEWLDVNYGEVMRRMLVDGLGGTAVHVIAPTAMPFTDTATTGAITCFRTGRDGDEVRFRAVDEIPKLGSLGGGRPVVRSRLEAAHRWSPFLRPAARVRSGRSELGELCRVHRGQVTGCNEAWIAGAYPGSLPDSVLVPSVTRARELFDARIDLLCADKLRRVIDLPIDLGVFDDDERAQIREFLAWARSRGADSSYVARNRRAWWAVGLREPAPILATYMARRPPAFVRNICDARHLNIAHGIYPREPLSAGVLDALAEFLRGEVCMSAGRTYAGGLTKFEPRELERVPIPTLDDLNERAQALDAC